MRFTGSMTRQEANRGFTLIELLVTLAVIATLSLGVAPFVRDIVEKQRLVGAVEAVHSQFVLAKSEALKRSEEVHVRVVSENSNVDWWVGIGEEDRNKDGTDDGNCDPKETTPSAGDACTLSYLETDGSTLTRILRVTDNTGFAGVELDSSEAIYNFDPVRGTVGGGNVELESDNYLVRIVISGLGRLRICSPTGGKNLGRYTDC